MKKKKRLSQSQSSVEAYEPFVLDERVKLFNGDCVEELRKLPDCSVDSVVTDPPYHLTSALAKSNGATGVDGRSSTGFMGQQWDGGDIAFRTEIWEQCLRVLKPGGHLLAFSGSRTYHRMVCAIEDAGFEVRDQIMWVYGSGFPKSLDVSKAIDKMHGAEPQVIGYTNPHDSRTAMARSIYGSQLQEGAGQGNAVTVPATDDARRWQGWGTALKPAHEPIVLARKPLDGTVAETVLAHGTGALNIDGCRISSNDGYEKQWDRPVSTNIGAGGQGNYISDGSQHRIDISANKPSGRWPANFIHDGSDEVLELFPETAGGARPAKANKPTGEHYEGGWGPISDGERIEFSGGSAARFFYCAKANKRDRNEGLEGRPKKKSDTRNEKAAGLWHSMNAPHENNHPTVKPTDLMRYLIRLVTPPSGTVLDPFMGSGSTGKAALLENKSFIGVEKQSDYFNLARARITAMFEEINE